MSSSSSNNARLSSIDAEYFLKSLRDTDFEMAPEDTKAPFLRVPWIARMIEDKSDLVFCVPGSRKPKKSTEDSLFAEILRTPRTIRSCICFHQKPANDEDHVQEVNILMTLGDGMNGHPDIIHGGIVATIIDEAMGMYQGINNERARLARVKSENADGKLQEQDVGAFTAELKITYRKPVTTPGALVVTTRRVKKEGRKEWLSAEVKQCQGHNEDNDGEMVTCAVGESLYVQPRPKAAKL